MASPVRVTPAASGGHLNAPSKGPWGWISVAAGMAFALFLFHPFFVSAFGVVYGDMGDGRLSIDLLEHWTNVVRGRVPITSPNFYFPERGVLGYGDAYILQAIPYVIARLIGLDRYLASEIAMILMAVTAFASMLYLLRRVLNFGQPTALLGALLFMLSSYTQSTRTPLYAVAFVPLLIAVAAEYWRLRNVRPRRALGYVCAFGVLLALLLFTSFYIGWFAIVSFGAVSLVMAALAAVAGSGAPALRETAGLIWAERRNLVMGASAFALSLVPFLIVFLPAHARVGNRPYAQVAFAMLGPLGVFDVGRGNFLWGQISGKPPSPGYYEPNLGWPVVMVLAFVVTSIYCAWQIRRGHPFRLVLSISLACAALWLSSVKFGGVGSLWILLYKLVPGGGAIRVPARIDIVLNVGVIIVTMFGFDNLMRAVAEKRVRVRVVSGVFAASACTVLALVGEQHAAALGVIVLSVDALLRAMRDPCARRVFVGGGLALILIVEQLNSSDPHHFINRTEEISRFSRIGAVPVGCSAFFVSNVSSDWHQMILTQIDAMLLAQQIGIPTVNGYTSWAPKGWDLQTPGIDINHAVHNWLEERGSSIRVCSLDFDSGRWVETSPPQRAKMAP